MASHYAGLLARNEDQGWLTGKQQRLRKVRAQKACLLFPCKHAASAMSSFNASCLDVPLSAEQVLRYVSCRTGLGASTQNADSAAELSAAMHSAFSMAALPAFERMSAPARAQHLEHIAQVVLGEHSQHSKPRQQRPVQPER